jgi:hypothetical protein
LLSAFAPLPKVEKFLQVALTAEETDGLLFMIEEEKWRATSTAFYDFTVPNPSSRSLLRTGMDELKCCLIPSASTIRPS